MATTTTKPRLPLRIRDATEADVPAITDIFYDAFGAGVISRMLYPRGHTDPSVRAKFAESIFAPPEEQLPSEERRPLPVENVVMVAEALPDGEGADGEDGVEIIAFAKWRIVKEALTEAEWDVEIKDRTAEEAGPWMDLAFSHAFQGGLRRAMKGHEKGEPLIHLSILACKPARHRSGAGSALLRWGVDKADREGKVAFLEASPAGYPLYRRFGWADVGVQDLDLASFGAKQGEGEDWGGEVAVALAGPKAEGVYRSALMKRVPKQTG